jgi:DNA-binding transcriptional regulator YdaS (Cro superfamily)
MASSEGHHRPVFPDQKKKIDYLVWIRQDRRPRDPTRRGYALGERSRIVSNQATLAAALGVSESDISRWKGGVKTISPAQLAEICRIFAIDSDAFQTLPYEEFCKHCERVGVRSVTSDWRSLVRGASEDHARILLRHPRDSWRLRYAELVAEPGMSQPVPKVTVETPFWIELSSPNGPNGRPLWAAWHLLLFNHEVRTQMFKCLLPAYEKHSAFGEAIFPSAAVFVLPREPRLWHRRGDLGRYEMVIVAAQERLPERLRNALAREQAQGLAIENLLEQVAEWIQSRAPNWISMAKAAYDVIPVARQR